MVRPNVDVDYYDRDVVFARRSNTGWSVMRDRVSALVMLGHQMVEQAHAPARAPALVDFALRRAERGAGDIEMRPGRLADEARQKLRRRDGAAVAAASVLHVGDLRIDHFFVFGRKRHAPHALAGR